MTTQNNTANAFEQWREMFQKSTAAWTQAAGATSNPFWPPFFGGAPGAAPGFGQMPGFGAAPGFNPFAQFTPPPYAGDLQQVWQQFYSSWAEQLKNAMASGTPGPEALLNAQKQWSEQLEAMAKMFTEVMGTEAFASVMGKYMEQSLHLQERIDKQAEPQIDTMLRAFNLPSRGQIDRMFERVIGLEELLDDLQEENRKLRAQVEAALRAPAARPRGRATEAPPTSE